MAETRIGQGDQNRGAELPLAASSRFVGRTSEAIITSSIIDAFVEHRRQHFFTRPKVIHNEEQIEAKRRELRAQVERLPLDSPERTKLLELIAHATTVREILNLAPSIQIVVAAVESADMNDDIVRERLIKQQLTAAAAEQELIQGDWDFNRVQDCEDFARSTLGLDADDPDALRIVTADIADSNTEAGQNARLLDAMTPNERAEALANLKKCHEDSLVLINQLIDREQNPEHRARLQSIRDIGELLERKDTLSALTLYHENGDGSWQKVDLILIQFGDKVKQVQDRNPNISEASATKVAKAEYHIDTWVNQTRNRDLSLFASINDRPIDARKLSEELSLMTRSPDAQVRADAIKKAFAEDWATKNPNQAIDQASLDQSVQDYIAKNPPNPGPVIPLKDLIGTAMEHGAKTMYDGNDARAKEIVNQIYGAMSAPDSGYTQAQAEVAKEILTRGAEWADWANAYGGRKQLLEVISDPDSRAKLIAMTMDDITKSTPGHLQLTAEAEAQSLMLSQLSYDTISPLLYKGTDRAVVAHGVFDHINDAQLNLAALGINGGLSNTQKVWELRNKLKEANVTLVDSNGDGTMDVAEINAAISKAVTNAPAPAAPTSSALPMASNPPATEASTQPITPQIAGAVQASLPGLKTIAWSPDAAAAANNNPVPAPAQTPQVAVASQRTSASVVS